jgi:hypothetical protein
MQYILRCPPHTHTHTHTHTRDHSSQHSVPPLHRSASAALFAGVNLDENTHEAHKNLNHIKIEGEALVHRVVLGLCEHTEREREREREIERER